MGSPVYHVEGVELTDRGRYARNRHAVVGLYQQGRVRKTKDNHVVDRVKLVEGVNDCSVLPRNVDFQTRDFCVDVAEILSNDEGELLVLVESSGEVKVDGHGVVAQRVQVGVHDLCQRNIAQTGNGGGEDADSSLYNELDGRVVKVESDALGKGSVADADAVNHQSKDVLGVKLPASHGDSQV